jgi:hypothetical protein
MAQRRNNSGKQTNEIRLVKTGELSGRENRNGRSATGGKIFNGRSENGKFNLRNGLD